MFQRTTAFVIRAIVNSSRSQARRNFTVDTSKVLANVYAQVPKPSITPASDELYDSFLKLVVRPGELSGIDGYFINENTDIWRVVIDKKNLTTAEFNKHTEVTARALLAIHLIRRRIYNLYAETPQNDPRKKELERNWHIASARTQTDLKRGIHKLVSLMDAQPDFPFGQYQNLSDALKHYLLPFDKLKKGETEKAVEDILFICKNPPNIAFQLIEVLNWMRLNNVINESNLNKLKIFAGNLDDLNFLSNYLRQAGTDPAEKLAIFNGLLRKSTASVEIEMKKDCSTTPEIINTSPRARM